MKGADKDFIVVEDATTGVTHLAPTVSTRLGVFQCENFFDYAANWINKRFL